MTPSKVAEWRSVDDRIGLKLARSVIPHSRQFADHFVGCIGVQPPLNVVVVIVVEVDIRGADLQPECVDSSFTVKP
jgi:hypothetical protein